MSEMNREVIGSLNHLIETCRDGQRGFEQAAKSIGDPALRAELMQYSMQRREFATALQQAVRTVGEEPEESGSASGALHAGWINLKNAITGNDDYSVLSECERGEDVAVDAYRDAMSQPVPVGLDDLVETQYSAIKHVHDRIRSLREANRPVQ